MVKPHWVYLKKSLFSIVSEEFTENPKNRVGVKIKIYIFMKTLELNQMEKVQAGNDVTTGAACAGAAIGIATTVLAIIAIPATGGLSALFWGVSIARGFATGAAIGSCAIGLTES